MPCKCWVCSTRKLLTYTRRVKFFQPNSRPQHSLSSVRGASPVLLAADLKVRHAGLNCRLVTARGSLVHDYASRNSALIYGLDSWTTAPYTHKATADVFDSFWQGLWPLNASVCSAFSLDHLSTLIDTTCRLTFRNIPDLPDFMQMGWVTFHAFLEDRLPGNMERLHPFWKIATLPVEGNWSLSSAVKEKN
jgi:hypothetical protein